MPRGGHPRKLGKLTQEGKHNSLLVGSHELAYLRGCFFRRLFLRLVSRALGNARSLAFAGCGKWGGNPREWVAATPRNLMHKLHSKRSTGSRFRSPAGGDSVSVICAGTSAIRANPQSGSPSPPRLLPERDRRLKKKKEERSREMPRGQIVGTTKPRGS